MFKSRLAIPALALFALALATISFAYFGRASAATFTVNSAGDGGDVTPGNGVCETSTAGECTLRAAIEEANAFAGTDTIEFNIAPAGPQTITPVTGLPSITDPVIVDGTTQPGFVGSPIVQIDGTIAGPLGADGLRITGGGTTVRGLVINRFASFLNAGIFLQGGGGNVIEGNYLGTDVTGTIALSNHVGIEVQSGSNTIGGTTAPARNLISGNIQHGIRIEDNFGGTTTGAANGNTVRGNYIGTDVTGLLSLTNNFSAIFVNGPSGTMIGGTAGTTPGGPCTGACNLVSGNNHPNGVIGINLGGGTGNIVQGNFIGTDVTGNVDLGNSSVGVLVAFGVASSTIGGTTPAARNVISGNDRSGIEINSTSGGSVVQGNFIGTNATGTVAVGNASYGITINTASNNTIGGSAAGAGNVISGNLAYGVVLSAPTTSSNTLQGNFIGTQADGTSPLGNGQAGIIFDFRASNNTIGGAGASEGNTIAFNTGDGVDFSPGGGGCCPISNDVLANSIHSNGGIGIDLNSDGVSANDLNDPDTGPNNMQNFPIVTSALSGFGVTQVAGSLNSTANTTFRLEFFSSPTCDPSGNGEGKTFLGSTNVTTVGNDVSFAAIVATSVVGDLLTATATDPNNNTSEFSACRLIESAVTGGTPPPSPTPSPTPTSTTAPPTASPTPTPAPTTAQPTASPTPTPTAGPGTPSPVASTPAVTTAPPTILPSNPATQTPLATGAVGGLVDVVTTGGASGSGASLGVLLAILAAASTVGGSVLWAKLRRRY